MRKGMSVVDTTLLEVGLSRTAVGCLHVISGIASWNGLL